MRQQVREVIQLHHTIDRMARMLEAHPVHHEIQWLLMNECMQDRVTMQDYHHNQNVRWGTGITDMTANLLANARVCKAAPA